nr:MaoC family dehydratase [Candidatus Freyarchaeota archaeon]
MTEETADRLRRLRHLIDSVLEEVGSKRIRPDAASVRRFCELIGEDNPVYFDDDAARKLGYPGALVPQSYLLTLLSPPVEELFIVGAEKLFSGLVRGVIHTESEVVYLKPLLVGESYVLRLESESLREKRGRKGDYYVWVLRAIVSSEAGEEMAYDRHTFFMKI